MKVNGKNRDCAKAGVETNLASAPGSAGRWLLLATGIVILDRVTKVLASQYLTLHEPQALFPSLNLTLVHNTGAAFSILGQAGGWQRWLFIFLAAAVSLGIVVWLLKTPAERPWFAYALALILGGAVGNLWDRVVSGYVVDFIDVYYGAWHWPAFNIADAAITVGAAMILYDGLKRDVST